MAERCRGILEESNLRFLGEGKENMNTRDWNETLRSLNVGLPDDVERLKAAGYYEEAIARIDAYLAEDWTMTQNSPYSQGLCPHMDVQPENPTPHGVDVLRDATDDRHK